MQHVCNMNMTAAFRELRLSISFLGYYDLLANDVLNMSVNGTNYVPG